MSSWALTISAPAIDQTTLSFETGGTPNSVNISFTLADNTTITAADVVIDVHKVASLTETLDSTNRVISITKLQQALGSRSINWDGLWLIDGEMARKNGTFKFVISASSGSTSATSQTVGPLTINSMDIHSITTTPTIAVSGDASFPYTITYALAKDALVSAVIMDASSQTIRTLLTDKPQVGEATGTHTIQWDGLDDNGRPVALGIYHILLDARDPSSADRAIQRSRTLVVGSLASPNLDPKKLFESNVVVYPNPVRDGAATIQYQAVRSGASISIKIYNIAGDLVRETSIGNVSVGNIGTFLWDTHNSAGGKVGRGLYFVVVKETDSEGFLMTTKKVAVLQ